MMLLDVHGPDVLLVVACWDAVRLRPRQVNLVIAVVPRATGFTVWLTGPVGPRGKFMSANCPLAGMRRKERIRGRARAPRRVCRLRILSNSLVDDSV